MDLVKLRYFVEVCRFGSMTKAAEILFVSQQNISKAIASLERELDVTLFVRSGNTLLITQDGEYLLQKANWMLAEENVIRSHFQEKSKKGQTIFLGGTNGLLPRCGKAPQQFILGENTRFNIAYFQRSPQKLEEEIRAGVLRFGLSIYHEEMEGVFDIIPLFKMDPLFIVSKHHPLAKHDRVSAYQMSQYPLVAPDVNSAGGRQQDKFFRSRGLVPYIVLSSNVASEVIDLVRNNDTFIGGITDRDFDKISAMELSTLRLADPADPVEIVLIIRKGEALKKEEREFRDALVRTFSLKRG